MQECEAGDWTNVISMWTGLQQFYHLLCLQHGGFQSIVTIFKDLELSVSIFWTCSMSQTEKDLFIPLAQGDLWWVYCPPPCAQLSVWDRWASWCPLSLSQALQEIQTLRLHNPEIYTSDQNPPNKGICSNYLYCKSTS